MSITAACGTCGKTYTVGENLIGRTAKCKQCGHPFRIEPAQQDGGAMDPFAAGAAAPPPVRAHAVPPPIPPQEQSDGQYDLSGADPYAAGQAYPAAPVYAPAVPAVPVAGQYAPPQQYLGVPQYPAGPAAPAKRGMPLWLTAAITGVACVALVAAAVLIFRPSSSESSSSSSTSSKPKATPVDAQPADVAAEEPNKVYLECWISGASTEDKASLQRKLSQKLVERLGRSGWTESSAPRVTVVARIGRHRERRQVSYQEGSVHKQVLVDVPVYACDLTIETATGPAGWRVTVQGDSSYARTGPLPRLSSERELYQKLEQDAQETLVARLNSVTFPSPRSIGR